MKTIRTLLFVLIGLCLLFVVIVALVRLFPSTPPLCPSCNVILISVDTLGAKHTSVYDASLDTTPNLARWARERGVVFEAAFAQAPWTLPSHAAMFTGSYPWDIGIMEAGDALPDSVTTIAEVLRDAGYRTHALSNGAFVNPLWNMTQGFLTFEGSLLEEDWNDLPQLFTQGTGVVHEYTSESSAPFFLLLRPFMVHDPYGDPAGAGVDIHDIVAANRQLQTSTSTEATQFRAAYRTEVRLTDEALDAFLTDLDSQGLLDTTVVIITADHGEEFGEHGTVGAHSVTVHRENLWVPLIVIAPGVSPGRVAATVEIRSVPATIAELVGAPTSMFAGASLVPFLTGRETADRVVLSQTALTRESFLEHIEQIYANPQFFPMVVAPAPRTLPVPNFTQSVIQGPWHLIQLADGATMYLFNMHLDPQEHNDVLHRLEFFSLDAQQQIRALMSHLLTS